MMMIPFRKDSLSLVMMSDTLMKAKLAVIGGGAAGLSAAREAIKCGVDPRDIIVLEARQRMGGRILSGRQGIQTSEPAIEVGGDIFDDGVSVDVGASWIHGADPSNPIVPLVSPKMLVTHEGNVWMDPQLTDIALYHNGKLLPECTRNQICDASTRALQRLNEMASLCDDPHRSLASAVEELMQESWVTQLSPAVRSGIRWYVLRVEAWLGSSSNHLKLGEFEELDGWGDYPGPHAFPYDLYDQLIGTLLRECRAVRIFTGAEVTAISYAPSGARIETADGRVIECLKSVVTIPLSLLQDSRRTIVFSPPLPPERTSAINKCGFGLYTKIFIRFTACFWDKTIKWMGCTPRTINESSSDSTPGFTLFLNYNALKQVPIIVAFAVGDTATAVSKISADQVVRSAVKDFVDGCRPGDISYDDAMFAVRGYLITRWERDPFSAGAYSFTSAKSHDDSLHTAFATPLENTLFFAGEACHEEYQGSVHAALLTGGGVGRTVAKQLAQNKDGCKEYARL